MDLESLFQKYVLNGGVLMFVLVPCSLLMLGAILQGAIVLRRGRVIPRWILRLAVDVRDEPTRVQFLKKIRASGTPLARILWAVLRDVPEGGRPPAREALQGRLEEAIIGVSDKMYDMVGLLSTIYTIGPLLGLVGTILGLMDTFHAYGASDHPSIKMLSEGVQKALVTTFWGLSMAIPAFVAGQWMQKKIRGYERDTFPDLALRVVESVYADVAPAAAPEPEAAAEPAGHARGTLLAPLAAQPMIEADSQA